ncbi:MAG: hypothetical protein KGJ93_03705, partial [Patescibacteria group bacterium]|nr:hypothetical protein [Patescibacteria group bacterium]
MDMQQSSPAMPPQTVQAPAGHTVPVMVKVIAVLYYIGSVFGIFGGVLTIFGGAMFGAALTSAVPFAGFMGGAMFMVLGVFVLAMGVLAFFVGRGLWQGKSWARMTAIVLAGLGVLSAIGSITQGKADYVTLVIQGAIGAYLWFSSEVKQAFV